MELRPLDILVLKGYWFNPVTHIIFTRTSTTWTHCAVWTGKELVEAVASGVKRTPLEHYKNRAYRVMRYAYPLHDSQVEVALDWLNKQVAYAVGYDYLALLGFLTGLVAFDRVDKYYCAELPAYMLIQAKVFLWNEIPAFIYPCEYIRNYNFKEVTQ